MLTDCFGCYKLYNEPTPFQEEKNFTKTYRLQNVHYNLILKKLFTHAFRNKLATIMQVQDLHSKITYFGCYSSLNLN